MLNTNIVPLGINSGNMQVGRGPAVAPYQVVLHGMCGDLDDIDARMCISNLPGTKHSGFHFGLDGNNIHSYAALTNTATSFGTSPAPVLPAGPGTADQKTINIAIAVPPALCRNEVFDASGCALEWFDSKVYDKVGALLAYLETAFPALTSTATPVIDGTELPGFDLAAVLACKVAALAAAALPDPEALRIIALLNSLPSGGALIPGTVVIGLNGLKYTV